MHANAFMPFISTQFTHVRFEQRRYSSTTDIDAAAAKSKEEDVKMTRRVIINHIDTTEEDEKPIMDIPPPMPAAAVELAAKPKPAAAKKAPKKKGNPHKEGVFSPIVVAAGTILGDEQLIKVRAKITELHSDRVRPYQILRRHLRFRSGTGRPSTDLQPHRYR